MKVYFKEIHNHFCCYSQGYFYMIFEIRLNGSHLISENGIYWKIEYMYIYENGI